MTSPSVANHGADRPEWDRFRHEAWLYAGQADFVAGATSFMGEAIAADEPILVMVGPEKINRLRSALGADAAAVVFADMVEVGRNPNRIIPAWQDFVAGHAAEGRRLRGIGEPIWAGRSPAELVEAQHHERLLNVAFADASAFWLLCPYDTAALGPEVVAEAHRNHPFVWDDGGPRPNPDYGDQPADGLSALLPDPPEQPVEFPFDRESLDTLRAVVARQAAAAGFRASDTATLVVAVNEAATNSICHGGGCGTLRMWCDGDVLVGEVRDQGRIDQPLVGRERPTIDQPTGRGLWIVNQLCDLVQVRSSPTGMVIRLHLRQQGSWGLLHRLPAGHRCLRSKYHPILSPTA